jgi:hypothetical protein
MAADCPDDRAGRDPEDKTDHQLLRENPAHNCHQAGVQENRGENTHPQA